MENRLQRAVCIALGVLAAALMACVVFRYASAGGSGGLSLAPAALTEVSHYGLIDLNHASEQELQTLPGIGETLARRIVEYREENGGFQSEEDVLAVRGVGAATYEKIEPYITY